MQKPKFLIVICILLIILSCKKVEPDVIWKVKKELPAHGLTLGYSLPKEHLVKIVGEQFDPIIDKNGNGTLMLFVAASDEYFLNNIKYEDLRIAHILVFAEGSLNSPFTLGTQNQKLNTIFENYNFQIDTGTVILDVVEKRDSLFVRASLRSNEGGIEIKALIPNSPGDWQFLQSTKVSATSDQSSYFIGDEAYRPIIIDSVELFISGKNWISQLDLPPKPDTVWLNIDFSLDFRFTSEKD